MQSDELPEWCGHVPRDRVSVWYLGPRLGYAAFGVLAALAGVLAGAGFGWWG